MDRDVSVAHLIYFMKTLLSAIFHRDVTVRLRPGYFPFRRARLRARYSVSDLRRLGLSRFASIRDGWNCLPCGLVNPAVLRYGGVDPGTMERLRLRPGSDAPGDDALRHRRYSPVHERRSAFLEAVLSDEVLLQLAA